MCLVVFYFAGAAVLPIPLFPLNPLPFIYIYYMYVYASHSNIRLQGWIRYYLEFHCISFFMSEFSQLVGMSFGALLLPNTDLFMHVFTYVP
jgi:hypothetical protein